MNEQPKGNSIPEHKTTRSISSSFRKVTLVAGALILAACTPPASNRDRLGPITPTIESTTPTGIVPVTLPTDIGEILTRATQTPTETAIPASPTPTPTSATADLPSDIGEILGKTQTPEVHSCRDPIVGNTKIPNETLMVYMDGVFQGNITTREDGWYGFTFGDSSSTSTHRVEVRRTEYSTIKVVYCTFIPTT